MRVFRAIIFRIHFAQRKIINLLGDPDSFCVICQKIIFNFIENMARKRERNIRIFSPGINLLMASSVGSVRQVLIVL